MTASLKVVSMALGITGTIGGAVSITLWKTGVINASFVKNTSLNSSFSIPDSTNPKRGTQESQDQLPVDFRSGNCEVIDSSKIDIFLDLGIDRDNYVTIYCTNSDEEKSEKKIVDNWTGLFPEEFFIGYYALPIGTRFSLKMKTELVDERDGDFKSSFSSNKFWNSPIEGIWGDSEQTILGKSVTKIQVTSEDHKQDGNIYILFGQKV